MTPEQILEHHDRGEQTLAEQIKWLAATMNGGLSEAMRGAYRAGFFYAWDKSRAMLNLHGLIK